MQKRRRLAMIVALILAALMVIPAIISGIVALMPEANAAVTQSDINKTKAQIAALKQSKANLQKEISGLKDKKADVEQRKVLYDTQMTTIMEEIDTVNEMVAQLNLSIAERQEELDASLVEERELKELFIARVRAMEDMGEVSYLGVLLQAESLTDMLTRWDTVREIIARDQKIAEDLSEKRKGIQESMAQLEADKVELYDYKRELASSQAELAELSAETDAMMADYLAEMADAQAQMEDVDKNLNAAEKERIQQEEEWKRIQEELQKSNSKYVGGEYLWPVPGYEGKISSPYGMRLHPVYKVQKMHTGIDIPAPKGTKIVASNSGKIAVKTYSSSYGNYIVIDHGGGQSTLYAHMSAFAKLSVGSEVTRGDVIGYVGTTGVSTGNHLHFEIRVNGQHTNPEPKLRNK